MIASIGRCQGRSASTGPWVDGEAELGSSALAMPNFVAPNDRREAPPRDRADAQVLHHGERGNQPGILVNKGHAERAKPAGASGSRTA